MLMTVIVLRLLGWDLLWGAVFTQQVLALLEAVPGAEPHITQFLPASWWSCVTRDFHMVKRPSGTTSFSQWIELNGHRKLIILKLSKPHNNYCGVLDGDRNGCRPSQSCPSSPSHILDFAWPWSWVCRIVLYLWRAAEPLWPSPLLNLRGPTVHKNLCLLLFCPAPSATPAIQSGPATCAASLTTQPFLPRGIRDLSEVPMDTRASPQLLVWVPSPAVAHTDLSAKVAAGPPSSLLLLFQAENKQEKGGTPWCPVPSFPKTE